MGGDHGRFQVVRVTAEGGDAVLEPPLAPSPGSTEEQGGGARQGGWGRHLWGGGGGVMTVQ